VDALMWLAPLSLTLGLIGLLAFGWTFASGQYEDPEGDAARILLDDEDEVLPASGESLKQPDGISPPRPKG